MQRSQHEPNLYDELPGARRVDELELEGRVAVVGGALELGEGVDELVVDRGELLEQEAVDPVDGEGSGNVAVDHVESLGLQGTTEGGKRQKLAGFE